MEKTGVFLHKANANQSHFGKENWVVVICGRMRKQKKQMLKTLTYSVIECLRQSEPLSNDASDLLSV